MERRCGLPEYLAAVIAGGPRYDLHGNPRGEITSTQIEQAKAKLAAVSSGVP
jgi:sRNA-binding protein